MKDNSLSLLASDKEGGSLLLPVDLYKVKARDAISSVFQSKTDISLPKVKSEVKKLCRRLNLDQLVKRIDAGKQLSLELFFTAKTHKVDCPLCVIVSAAGTWQKTGRIVPTKRIEFFKD